MVLSKNFMKVTNSYLKVAGLVVVGVQVSVDFRLGVDCEQVAKV